MGNFREIKVNGTMTIPQGYNFYHIKKYSTFNQYRFTSNTNGFDISTYVSVGDLYAMIGIGTSTAMVTNHGTFGVLSDTDLPANPGQINIYHSFLKLPGQ